MVRQRAGQIRIAVTMRRLKVLGLSVADVTAWCGHPFQISDEDDHGGGASAAAGALTA